MDFGRIWEAFWEDLGEEFGKDFGKEFGKHFRVASAGIAEAALASFEAW